jgi:hypothetical protein
MSTKDCVKNANALLELLEVTNYQFGFEVVHGDGRYVTVKHKSYNFTFDIRVDGEEVQLHTVVEKFYRELAQQAAQQGRNEVRIQLKELLTIEED